MEPIKDPDQVEYESLCTILGDVVAQISQLNAIQHAVLVQIAKLKSGAIR